MGYTAPTWIKSKPHASAEKQVGDSDPSARIDVINRVEKGYYAVIRRILTTLGFDTVDFTDQTTVTSLGGPTVNHLHVTDLAAITTAAESWIGPSSTAGVYFEGGAYGFGTTGPVAKLHVNNTTTGDNIISRFSNNEAGNAKIIETYINGSAATVTLLGVTAANGGFTAYQNFSDFALGTYDNVPFSISTSNAKRVTVLGNGNVGIGTTHPDYLLEVNTDSAGKPGVGGLWTVVSDERLKDNIIPADLDRCWEIVHPNTGIRLVRATWKPDVYTLEQVSDRSALMWTANDTQRFFPKSVNVKPFTKAEKIPDGEEEYEEQAYELEAVEQSSIEIIDGVPTLVKKPVVQKRLLFDNMPVLNVHGQPVIEPYEQAPATKTEPAVMGVRQMMHPVPRMGKKTRPKYRQEVVKDCLDLNSGQIIAAMYGALQKSMQRIEKLEAALAMK